MEGATAAGTTTKGPLQRPPDSTGWRSHYDRYLALGLGLLVLIGLLLRWPSFSDALLGDELSTYVVVHGNSLGRLLDLVHSDQEVTPPLYFMLATVTQHIGSASDWLRLPALLAGLAAIPLTYELGRRTVGRQAALVGAGLITISPFLIYYSTEARSYAVSMLICLLATLSLVRASEENSGSRGWWVAYAVFAAAAMYTHYTNVFVLFAAALWVFVARPGCRRALLIATLGAAVIFLPWVPGYLEDGRSPGADVIGQFDPFGLYNLQLYLPRTAFGAPYTDVGDLPGPIALGAIAAGLALGIAGAARFSWRPSGWWLSAPTMLIVALAFAAPLGNIVYSLVTVDIFGARNMITSWPGWALLIGAIVTGPVGRAKVVSMALVLAGFVTGAALMLDPHYQRPDFDAAASYLISHGTATEPIVYSPSPAPGAKEALEVSLADDGEGDRKVLRVGIATLADAEAIRAPGAPGQFTGAPIQPGGQVAKEALADAHGGNLFYVSGGDAPFDVLKGFLKGTVQGDFLSALPSSYKLLSTERFPGLVGGVSVYELGSGGGGR